MTLAVARAGAEPEFRHYARHGQQPVEIGAADMNAGSCEDVAGPVSPAPPFRRHPHQRKVRGASAEVDDQPQLLDVYLPLVVERRRDRLELEGDVDKALRPNRPLELVLRRAVGRGVVVEPRGLPRRRQGRRLPIPSAIRLAVRAAAEAMVGRNSSPTRPA